MKLAKDYIIILTCLVNMAFLIVSYKQTKDITASVTFDVDLARDQFRNEVRSFYVRGCTEGTYYPPAWHEAVGIFNKHSVDFYCNEKVEHYDDYINQTTFGFSRKH